MIANKSKPKMKPSGNVVGVVVLVIGFVLLVAGSLAFSLGDSFIREEIIKKVSLVNGSEAYPLWQNPPIPIYLQVWVFDCTNSEEVVAGGKPNVTQRGPYTYREERVKVGIEYHDNGTVSYRQIKTYHFVPERSVGWDNETFTTINIPYMTLVNGFHTMPGWIQVIISNLLNVIFRKEGVFLERSVRDIVWGYTDPILKMGKTFDKKIFNQDVIGILAGKNATDDGLYTVFTGVGHVSRLGWIDRYNGAQSVDFWTTAEANMVNGTDGTVAPPFINKSLIVRMFSTDICRSIYGTYHGEVKTLEDITLYRFTAPPAAMAAPSVNPDNAGFCTPAGNCLKSGVLNISTCQIVDTFHLPIVASSPHFYMADKEYVDAITNMKPDPAQHATNIDIEPNTGFVMQINKRLQINVHLQADTDFKKTAKLRNVIFPVLWFNESAMTDESHARRLKRELLIPKAVFGVVKYLIPIVGALLVLGTSLVTIISSLRTSTQKRDPPLDDEDEDLKQETARDYEHVSTSGLLEAPSIDPVINY